VISESVLFEFSPQDHVDVSCMDNKTTGLFLWGKIMNMYNYNVYPLSCDCLKNSVSETRICLCLQVELAKLDPIDRASPSLQAQAPTQYGVYYRRRPIDTVQKCKACIPITSSQVLNPIWRWLMRSEEIDYRSCNTYPKCRFETRQKEADSGQLYWKKSGKGGLVMKMRNGVKLSSPVLMLYQLFLI
jgi:ssDNA-binding Zn-finger/Zn-ribbon topoisomerase 1